ncbi:MAG: FG-GAP-like repeat-containing protein [Myxococcota bacterium]
MKSTVRLLALAALTGSAPAYAASFHTLLSTYSGYDYDGDGVDEIDSMNNMSFTWGNPWSTDRVVVVFVEKRLMAPLSSPTFSTQDLTARLSQLADDLRAEGYTPRFVETDVYDGTRHQDGKTLLAMREFLRDVQTNYPRLEGALLIGSFPEASLVRRWLWKRSGNGLTINGEDMAGQEVLRAIPEGIDGRAEIVLADLDGNWEDLYQEASTSLQGIIARPSSTSWWSSSWGWRTFDKHELSNHTFEDVFFIDDSQYSPLVSGATLWLYMTNDNRHEELTAADKTLPNPLARPDILVSRINPRHIAVAPNPAYNLLSSSGLPQTVTATLPGGQTPWIRDDDVERTLLIDFLDRNHRFRVGAERGQPFRAGAISYPERDFAVANLASYADDADTGFSSPLIAPTDPNLLEYVEWLKQPATLRAIMAHSNAQITEFGSGHTVSALESATGTPWRWRQSGALATPSFADQGGIADLYLHRTLWENNVLEDAGSSFFIHNGCETGLPVNAYREPYHHSRYGDFQNGEAQLFYLNGLAMISRAKVFYDRPLGIGDSLAGERTPFGEIWAGTFDVDGDDGALESDYAGHKRAYNWSLTGDWTLRMRYDNGISLLGGQGWALRADHTHANESWIDGWNYATSNRLNGAGDFDGDGTDEIVVTSGWGIGLLEHDGERLRAPVSVPNDTWFGSWRYNPPFHTSDDVIEGIGDFDGDGDDDLLITSEWGVGILRRSGTAFTSMVTLADNNFAGGWRYETHNDIVGIGDFNGDGKDDIVVESGWGIGVLTVSGGRLTSLLARPNDTWFGSWRYNAAFHTYDDQIEEIGDFDGDGDDDLLITSEWGIGILTLSGTSFTSLTTAANDTWLGSWRYNAAFHTSDDRILGVGDLDGDGADDILIGSQWGLGLMELGSWGLTTRQTWADGASMGHRAASGRFDTVAAVDDLTGDGRDEMVLRNYWTGEMVMLRGWGTYAYAYYPLQNGDQNGDHVHQWLDYIGAVGDLNPNTPGAEIALQR